MPECPAARAPRQETHHDADHGDDGDDGHHDEEPCRHDPREACSATEAQHGQK